MSSNGKYSEGVEDGVRTRGGEISSHDGEGNGQKMKRNWTESPNAYGGKEK